MCLTALGLVISGCLANPQRDQSVDLLDQLTHVRVMLGQDPRPPDTCNIVGDVETRLYGEPGLVSVQPAWSQLTDAAHALQAVCGQDALLDQPSSGSPAMQAARARWQQGVEREMSVACDHLRQAAAALNRDATC